MTEQERFESAMRQKFGGVVDLRICINSDGDYMAWDAQVAWKAWQAATAQAVPEGYVVVPTTNVHTFYQDDDEPENCCNDESEFDSLGDGLDDGDIMTVNKITLAQIPSGKFYGTWVVDASNRKFELFVSHAEAAQAIKAAQENDQ